MDESAGRGRAVFEFGTGAGVPMRRLRPTDSRIATPSRVLRRRNGYPHVQGQKVLGRLEMPKKQKEKTMSDFGEPWKFDEKTRTVKTTSGHGPEDRAQQSRRAVACVNALVGMNPDNLRPLLAALEVESACHREKRRISGPCPCDLCVALAEAKEP